jgi:hypothetical protein
VAQSGNKLHYVNVDPGISLSGEVERVNAPKCQILPKKEALGTAQVHWALLVLGLLRFLNDRVRSVSGHDPACRPGHDGFILKPQESEVVDALWEIRLDDEVSRNHGTWDVSIVGAIVAVRHRLRDRTDSSYIRSARYRVRAENVVGSAKCVLGAHEIRKRLVQEIYSAPPCPPRHPITPGTRGLGARRMGSR